MDAGDGSYQASGEFYVEFDIEYPRGIGLDQVPIQVHKATVNGVALYVGSTVSSLTVANMAPNEYGIALYFPTRSLQELARRIPVTANANGVAQAPGKILDTSAGSISGPLVTGLSASQENKYRYKFRRPSGRRNGRAGHLGRP